MKSINFDNPYLLLIAIPALALVLVPFFIAIRKENSSRSVITSLILHVLMVVTVTLGVAGMNVQTVVTQTQVVVVADVSYSASKDFDTVDDYVRGVRDGLPMNSQMGVVVFGRDYQLKTPLGAEFDTVSGSTVDDSATNIADALKYSETLFTEGVVKRVVLITDGAQTDGQSTEQVIAAVESLHAAGVKIDAIYLDSNIDENRSEVQISGVDFTKSTYLNHETTADVTVQSSKAMEAEFILYRKNTSGGAYEQVGVRAEKLSQGDNNISFDLDTSAEGVYDYRLEVKTVEDYSSHNNLYSFTQTVEGNLKTMLISSNFDDVIAVGKRYVGKADVEAYVRYEEQRDVGYGPQIFVLTYKVNFTEEADGSVSVHISTRSGSDASAAAKKFKDFDNVSYDAIEVEIPYNVEDLCLYDEIILSEFDVRKLDNGIAFMQNLKTVVDVFGKSLITAGDLQLSSLAAVPEDGEQIEEDGNALKTLQAMLPVTYGPSEQDAKLYGIVIDASRSMESVWRFTMAKQAAIQLINLLSDDDFITVVAFAGDVEFEQLPVRVGPNKAKIIADLQALEVRQGTFLGAALNKTLEFMNSMQFYQEQVMLITDGISSTVEADDPLQAVKDMRAASVVTSVINTGSKGAETLLTNLAIAGGGSYYYAENEADLAALILKDVADEVTDTEIETKTHVNIKRFTDDVLNGLVALPDVYGFLTATSKANAVEVLTVKYQKMSGGWVEVPLYAHCKCGEGKVATFTSKISGAWSEGWDGTEGSTFFDNVLTENTPYEKTDYPFKLTVEADGGRTRVEVKPHAVSTQASAHATLIGEDGSVISEAEMIFDSSEYYYEFETEQTGRYQVNVVYTRGATSYEASTVFNYCYLPEYDEFSSYDAATLNKIIRHRGTVSENGKVDLSNDESEIEMYTQYFTMYLMSAVVVMFVIDIIVRKLRWADIKGLFKKTKTGGRTK